MAVTFAVDIMDLEDRRIYRLLQLACKQCDALFEYAQLGPGGLPRYCADCAAERARQRARGKERRKMQRLREDPRSTTRWQLVESAARHGHVAMTVGRSLTCTRCWDVLGRRRGPAKSTVWFPEDKAAAACPASLPQPPAVAMRQVAAR